MPPLRVAVVGAGKIAEVHRRAAVRAGAELVGVLASTPQASREAAARWGLPTAYPDLDASDVDVVHVCTPNSSHVPYAVALARAGRHVVCEKPLGRDAREAAEAARAVAGAGVVATVPFVFRYHPLAAALRAQVQDEGFGRVHLVHGSYLQDWMLAPDATDWRVDPAQGGASRAFADIGSHWCDLATWVTGDPVVAVVATTSVAVPQRPAPTGTGTAPGPLVDVTTEDSALVLFRTAGGAVGSVVISQVAAGHGARLWLEVDGTRRSVTFDQDHPDELRVGSGSGATVVPRAHDEHDEQDEPPLEQWFDGFVAATYAAVRGERPAGLPTFVDGLRAARVNDAVLASVRTGTWVEVEPTAP